MPPEMSCFHDYGQQLALRKFALIAYAHPYCARNSCRNGMLRHARERAQKKKSIYMKGW